MKIAVLNGSPKGDQSATMQSVHFIQKKFPQHELKIHNVTQRMKVSDKNDAAFKEIIDDIKSADGVLWGFPLYFEMVHSQYKRFIELIFESGVQDVFQNKYAATLSTSIHYFDYTAHNYMNAICDDLDMKYTGSYSADMYDLMKEEERNRLALFAEDFFRAIENSVPTAKNYPSLIYSDFQYIPREVSGKTDAGDKKMVIITDCDDSQTNLVRMIDRFKGSVSGAVEVINLWDIDIKGGCQGCIQCGYDNTCAYTGKDGYIEFYNSRVKTADVLIYAGAIKDRYLSSRWKLFFDRSFFNTHTPTLIGKQMGFIISGPLGQIPNLRQILESLAELQQVNLVDFITDECQDSGEIDALLQNLAERSIRFSHAHYVKPETFLGVGGRKIFRDDIWGRLRFPFVADYNAYKRLGLYDFPQKNRKSRITNSIMIALSTIKGFRKEVSGRMKEEMIKPHKKVLKD